MRALIRQCGDGGLGGHQALLVELQALVDDSHLGNPRRVTVGLDHNRLSMLLAVLHRHGGIAVGDQDVFVNVVGGVKVLETSADLALLLAVISSFRDQVLPQNLVVFGEVGLAGEIRPSPMARSVCARPPNTVLPVLLCRRAMCPNSQSKV